MLAFNCACGHRLKVSNDLAGWKTKCPGCQQVIDVPSPEEPAPVAQAARIETAPPWKGIAIGTSCAAVIALIVAVASAGGSRAPAEETDQTVSRLKKELAEREGEVEALTAKQAQAGELAKLSERARLAEADRDRLRKELEAKSRQIDDYRRRLASAEMGTKPEPGPEAAPKPPPDDPPKEPAAAAPVVADPVAQFAPAVVIVTSDRDSGGGFFISADGLVLTSHRAIAQSESRTVTYIDGKGDTRMRVVAEAEVMAVDAKNDLAILKIDVRRLVPFVALEEIARVTEGEEIAVFGNPVPGTRSIDHSLTRGKIVAPETNVDGLLLIQTTIPLSPANAGVPAFTKDGKFVGATTVRGEASSLSGLLTPAGRVKALFEGRESTFAVKGPLRDWAAAQAGKGDRGAPPKEHATGIGVGGIITKFVLDEERDRIVGLDIENGCVAVMSLSKRKILRTIPTGPAANDLQMTVNPDVVWVGHSESSQFLKIDVADGRVFDRVDTGFRYSRFVATRNHLWTYGFKSNILTLKDKSTVSNPIKFGALTYDKRRDRLIGVVTNWDAMRIVEFDPDKVGPLLKDVGEIEAGGPSHPRWKEREDFGKRLEDQMKTSWSIPPRYEDWAATGHAITLSTDGMNRVFLNRFALKRTKMDAILTMYPIPQIPESTSSAAIDAMRRFPGIEQVKCASPDGRWIATGRHIFDADKGTVHLELPIPSPDSKFSSDSKILYIYDLHSRAIVPIEVEPKK